MPYARFSFKEQSTFVFLKELTPFTVLMNKNSFSVLHMQLNDVLESTKLTFTLSFGTIELFCRDDRARSACTYMQPNLALHSLLFYPYFLTNEHHNIPLHRLKSVCIILDNLTLSQTSPGFHVSVVQVFWKHCGKRRNCSLRAISPFPTVFSTCLKNFLPFSSNLILTSANSFSLEESEICHLVNS